MKKIIAFTAFIALGVHSVFGLDYVFKLEPMVVFPMQEYMQMAPGAALSGGIDLFNLVTVGAEGGYLYEKPSGDNVTLNSMFGGLNLGVYYYPLSRLYLGLGGAAGFVSYNSQNYDNFSAIYYRAFGEIGFRVNSAFSVNAIGGYASYNSSLSKSFLSGPFAGASLRFSGSVGNDTGGSAVNVRVVQDNVVYPVYTAVYQNEPFGTIIITNNDGAELRNVNISFRAGRYTSGAKLCGSVSRINRHSKMSFPLCADFSDEILKFTEDGKISGEVVIEYEFLGKKMTAVESVIISVNNRNAFTWGDNAALASFISPDCQEIATFAKQVAGITRNNLYTGMNANIQYAAGMVEGLRLIGISHETDASSPYQEYHYSLDLDSIQFPLQTLQYLTGDYEELGILLCSCLQTVNVPTGYIPVDNDFLVLVRLNIPADQALNHFASTDGLLIDEEANDVYIALSMAQLEKGFTASYRAGAKALAKCYGEDENCYEFIDTSDAWAVYKPVAYSNSSNVLLPKQEQLEKNLKAAIQSYIESDIDKVIARERAAGNTNKLGVALVRAGRYSEAKREFQKLSTVSAMNNTANILMIEKNYSAAAAQYRAVLAKDPKNKTALKGLENAKSKLE